MYIFRLFSYIVSEVIQETQPLCITSSCNAKSNMKFDAILSRHHVTQWLECAMTFNLEKYWRVLLQIWILFINHFHALLENH